MASSSSSSLLTFGPYYTNNETSEKLFTICRQLFPSLSKNELKFCFHSQEIYLNGIPVKGNEDEVKRIGKGTEICIKRDLKRFKQQQIHGMNLQILYFQDETILPLKPTGINGAVGRLFDEAIKFSVFHDNNEWESVSLYSIYRLPKNTGGLCLYATSIPAYERLRRLLCHNCIQISFVCVVVGTVESSIIPLPVTFSEYDEEKIDDTDRDATEKYCVMHSMSVDVIQVTHGHHIGALSLIRVTPSFLREYSLRDLRCLLRPSCTEEYQYLHYPISVIKAIPKALHLSGYTIVGGDRGLVKSSKGLFFYLDQVTIGQETSSPETLTDKLLTKTISVPIPDKFLKLMSSSRGKDCQDMGNSSEQRMALFCGLHFHITRDVMTPRPASEVLVREAVIAAKVKYSQLQTPVRVLDIGTGSGSLLLSTIRQLVQEKIPCFGVGIDICPKALRVAEMNRNMHGLDDKIIFLEHSFTNLVSLTSTLRNLCSVTDDHSFDLILCNPPYSSVKEDRISHTRRLNEPAIALFADVTLDSEIIHGIPLFHHDSSYESLTAFRSIASSLQQLSNMPTDSKLFSSQATMFLEFGNGQLNDVLKIFHFGDSLGMKISGNEVFQDHDGFPRCLKLELS